MSNHLTVEQRYTIFVMIQKPYPQKDISEALGVSKSTISRELRRNCDKRNGQYVMDLSQRKSDDRKRSKRHSEAFTTKMRKRAERPLKKGFNPEQITVRSRLIGIEMVSHETIYQLLLSGENGLNFCTQFLH